MKKITVKKPASKGIVMGKAFPVVQEKLACDRRMITDAEQDGEIAKFRRAVEKTVEQIEVLAKDNEIFGAHLEVAQDITLEEAVLDKIKAGNQNAELALENSKDEICAMFESLDDEYMRERAADVKDVCKRMLANMKGVTLNPFEAVTDEVIVLASDLAPSDTAVMDFNKILGFITEAGGVTSHVCIMARSMEIPALVGVGEILTQVKAGDFVILDAVEGTIILCPDEATIQEYEKKKTAYEARREALNKLKGLPAVTKDGRQVQLFANVGGVADVENAVPFSAEGVGLFRSEFLYMESKGGFPSEEEQFQVYKKAIEANAGHPMIIRTLDIGGDKELSYYTFDKEENPFLGWRAIRICLDKTDVFKAQLRALLRAGAYGDIRIMYPMIISVSEYRQASKLLEECKEELKAEGIAYKDDIQTGIMVETPASVWCAEELAKEVDFFSIGTNDLTQYTLAVDRGNQKIAHLYDSFHPAVLRSIRQVIQAGHKYGKEVGMCGEFAGDEKAVPVLLGMGLDEFSMAASGILDIRALVRELSYADCQKLADEICAMGTAEEIKSRLGVL